MFVREKSWKYKVFARILSADAGNFLITSVKAYRHAAAIN